MELNSKMNRSELLDTLRTNRDEHVALHKKALVRYEAALVKELKKQLARAEAKKKVNHSFLFKFPVPESHEASFNQVIDLLEHDVRDEIELSRADFQRFMRNEWEWSNQWATTNSTYNVRG